MSKEEITQLGNKARDYVQSEFRMEDTIDAWDASLRKLVKNWREGKRVIDRYNILEL